MSTFGLTFQSAKFSFRKLMHVAVKKHLPVICAVHTLSQSLRLTTESSYAIHGLRFIIVLCFFWFVIEHIEVLFRVIIYLVIKHFLKNE